MKPLYDQEQFVVTQTKGTQVIATRRSKTRVRNEAKVKKLWDKPKELMAQTYWEEQEVIEEDSDVDIEIDTREETAGIKHGEIEQAGIQQERNRARTQTTKGESTGIEVQESTGAVRKSSRVTRKLVRFRYNAEQNRAKPSPRKRRSIRSRPANEKIKEGWLLWNSLKGWVKG